MSLPQPVPSSDGKISLMKQHRDVRTGEFVMDIFTDIGTLHQHTLNIS
jgi:hypothetical protein